MAKAAMDRKVLEWQGGKLDFSAGCLLMGILNVTPDSFSDGGKFMTCEQAVHHGLVMEAEGAAIIDVGAESSRPGAKAAGEAEQIKRLVPVIEGLRKRVCVPISVDAYRYEVVRAAVEAGAGMINDITALSDERVAKLAAARKIPVILMHMQGTPETMQIDPQYGDVVKEVKEYLLARAEEAKRHGISREMIFIDPGIGFGKSFEHNIELMRNIGEFVKTGYKVLIGTSRKGFIGKITGKTVPGERVMGTAATVAAAAMAGVSIARVHDVGAMRDVVKVMAEIGGRG